jgi:hypothetical protein
VLKPAGLNIPWIVVAIIGIVIIWLLAYFKITIAAGVLGITLVCEVILLLALGVSVLFKGGPERLHVRRDRPAVAGVQQPARGCLRHRGCRGRRRHRHLLRVLVLGSDSETTAVYGEESKNPKRDVPLATMIAVIGLGVFYTFMSWMVVVGNGPAKAIEVLRWCRAGRPVAEPGRLQPRRSDRHRVRGAAGGRVLRLRHGLPQCGLPLYLRTGPRERRRLDHATPWGRSTSSTARRPTPRPCRA